MNALSSTVSKRNPSVIRLLAGGLLFIHAGLASPAAAASIAVEHDKAFPGEALKLTLTGVGFLQSEGAGAVYFSKDGKTGWTQGTFEVGKGVTEVYTRAYVPGNVTVTASGSGSSAKGSYKVTEDGTFTFTLEGGKKQTAPFKVTATDPGGAPGPKPPKRDLAIVKIEAGESSLMDRDSGKLPVYVTIKNLSDQQESRVERASFGMKMNGVELEGWKDGRQFYENVGSKGKNGSEFSFSFGAPLELTESKANLTAYYKDGDSDSTNDQLTANNIKLPSRPAIKDLAVAVSTLPASGAGKTKIRATVTNLGEAAAALVNVYVNGTFSGSKKFDSVKPGAAQTWETEFADPPPNGQKVTAVVGFPTSYKDKNNNNNSVSFDYLSAAPIRRELAVAISTKTASALGKTIAKVTVTNTGDRAENNVKASLSGGATSSKEFASIANGGSDSWETEFTDTPGKAIMLTASLPSDLKDGNTADNTAKLTYTAPVPETKWGTLKIAAETSGEWKSDKSSDDYFNSSNPLTAGKDADVVVDAVCDLGGYPSDGRKYKLRLYADGTLVTALKAAEFTCPAGAMTNVLTDAKYAATIKVASGKTGAVLRAEVIDEAGKAVAKAEKTYTVITPRDLAVKITPSAIISPTQVASAVIFEASNAGPAMNEAVTVSYALGSKKLTKKVQLKADGTESWTEDVSFLAGQTVDFTASIDMKGITDKNSANDSAKLSGIKVVKWDLALGDLSLGNGGRADKDGNVTVLVPVKNLSDNGFMLDLKEFGGKVAPTLKVGGQAAKLLTQAPFGTLDKDQSKTFEFSAKAAAGGKVAAEALLAVADGDAANNKKAADLAVTPKKDLALSIKALPQTERHSIQYEVTVTNTGDVDFEQAILDIYTPHLDRPTLKNIKKGASVTHKGDATAWPLETKTMTVGFWGGRHSDDDPSNDAASVSATGAAIYDLALHDLKPVNDFAVGKDGKMRVAATLSNEGMEKRRATSLQLKVGDGYATCEDCGQLLPGEKKTFTYSFDPPATSEPVEASMLRDDNPNNDNKGLKTAPTPKLKRDLAVSSIAAAPQTEKGSITFKITVKNLGTTLEKGVQVAFLGDTLNVGDVAPGGEKTIEYKATGLPSGRTALWRAEIIQPTGPGVLKDSDETNDKGGMYVKVAEYKFDRDLAVTLVALPQTKSGEGRVKATVRNLGEKAVTNVSLRFSGGAIAEDKALNLAKGAEETVEAVLWALRPGQTEEIKAYLVWKSRADRDEQDSNNSATAAVTGEVVEDLALHAIAPVNDFAVGADKKMRVAVTVSNEGKLAMNPDLNTVVQAGQQGAQCEDCVALKPGEKKAFRYKFDPPKTEVKVSASLLRDDNGSNNGGTLETGLVPVKQPAYDVAAKVTGSGIITSARIASAVEFSVENKGTEASEAFKAAYTLGNRNMEKSIGPLKPGAKETWLEDVGHLSGQTADFTLEAPLRDKDKSNNTAKLAGIKVVKWDLALGEPSAGNNGRTDASGNLLILLPVKNQSDFAFDLDHKDFGGKLAPTLTIEGLGTTLLTKRPFGILNAGQSKVFEFSIKQPAGKNRVAANADLALSDDDTGNNKSGQFLDYKPGLDVALGEPVAGNNGKLDAGGNMQVQLPVKNTGTLAFKLEKAPTLSIEGQAATLTTKAPFGTLNAGESKVFEFSIKAPAGKERVAAHADLAVTDGDSGNNKSGQFLVFKEDRNVGIADIEFDKFNNNSGATGLAPIKITLKNTGLKTEKEVGIRLEVAGAAISPDQKVASIEPGKTASAVFKVPVGKKSEEKSMTASLLDFKDVDAADDSLTKKVTLPNRAAWDLAMTSIEIADAVVDKANATMAVMVYFKNPGVTGRGEPAPTVALSMGGKELGRATAEGLTHPGRTNGVEVKFPLGKKEAKGKLKAAFVDRTDDEPKNDSLEVDATIPGTDVGWDYKVDAISIPDGKPKMYAKSLPLTIKIANVVGKYASDELKLNVKVEGASAPFSASAKRTGNDYAATIDVPLLANATMRAVDVDIPDFVDDTPADNKKKVNLAWPAVPPPPYRELAITDQKFDSTVVENSYYNHKIYVGSDAEETVTNVHLRLTMNGAPTGSDQVIESLAPGAKNVEKTFRIPATSGGKFKVQVSIVDFTDGEGKVQTTDAHPQNNVANLDLTINGPANPYAATYGASKVLAGTLDKTSVSAGSDVKLTCKGFPGQKEGDRSGVTIVHKATAQNVPPVVKDMVQTATTFYKRPGTQAIFSKVTSGGAAPIPDDPKFWIMLAGELKDGASVKDAITGTILPAAKPDELKFSHQEIHNDALFTVPSTAPKGVYRVIYYYERDPQTQCQADLTVS